MAVNCGHISMLKNMAGKNLKRKTPKKYPPDNGIKSTIEDPESAYTLTPLTVVHSKKEKNFVKRSLVLMGLASVVPFNNVENVSDFIQCIREGVPKVALDNLVVATGISTLEMAEIVRTSDRTLRRYSPKQKLNAEQSERVIELAKIYSRGEEVFGTLDAFKEWMNSTVMALGNKRPKEFLDTSMGIEMLMDELGRIEHGIFA
jgi:putative toxin-antitoxin system antitoxin component (TIGR02293 family)